MLAARRTVATLLCSLAIAACAQAGGATEDAGPDPADAPAVDAPVSVDARADAPVDAAPPDAGPPDARPPDAMPDACVPAWTQLLANGAFDAGDSVWLSSGGVITNASMMPIAPHSPSFAAWLAGYNGADEFLAQAVTVPAGATALRVRAHRCYVTSDTSGADDHFAIELRDASGTTVLESLASYTNLTVGTVCSWEIFTLPAAAAHAGETLRLHFHATTDGSFPTSFYVDSVLLQAMTCP